MDHEIKSKFRMSKNGNVILLPTTWPTMSKLVKHDSRSTPCRISLSVSWPTATTYFIKDGPSLAQLMWQSLAVNVIRSTNRACPQSAQNCAQPHQELYWSGCSLYYVPITWTECLMAKSAVDLNICGSRCWHHYISDWHFAHFIVSFGNRKWEIQFANSGLLINLVIATFNPIIT